MNICKKIISTICASVFIFSCFEFNVNAKVIEPEIVKTETWTTSYFIDNDMDTLYPYIQCEADIYNDGTIKLYMWNTHEWDGFATVYHKVTLVNTYLYSTNSPQFAAKFGGVALINNEQCDCKSSQKMDSIDISYYDSLYSLSDDKTALYYICKSSPSFYEVSNVTARDAYGSSWGFSVGLPQWSIPMSNIPYRNSREKIGCSTLRPRVDPTGTYNFRLFGHDITITPELLSGNIIAEPELTEQEKYIKQLEEENSKLKTEIESYKKLDFNGDGLLTNADAQMILVYYTNSLVGKTTGKVEDYGEYIKLISN